MACVQIMLIQISCGEVTLGFQNSHERYLYKTLCVCVYVYIYVYSVQFNSVTQSCLTLCDPMNCSLPGVPVYHHLAEFTQTNVHLVGDTIQPSHPLPSPSPPILNLSKHQGLFQ